jgi:phosphoribosylformylglycinamidine synthase PurS subunit
VRWRVRLAVLPLEGMRSPEGETALAALRALGFERVEAVTAGKVYEWTTGAEDKGAAAREAEAMAAALLANPVSERALLIDVQEAAP